jgi:hypothetical protein
MQASVKQSNMQATASNGNSTSQPTEQSKHCDTQFGFFFWNFRSRVKLDELELELDDPADDVDGVDPEPDEDEVEGPEKLPFEVDAP